MVPTKEEMLAAFEQRHGKELQKIFSGATVAVCGLGGLGSNISIALARAGIGQLILIDFDRVDVSNLHRQQYKASQVGMLKTDAAAQNLKEISPYIELEVINEKVTAQNASELLKNALAKAELVNTVLEQLPHAVVVAASGMAGAGSPNEIKTKRISKRFYLCGDFKSEVKESDGLFAPRVMLCAAHQAHTVLRILAGKTD